MKNRNGYKNRPWLTRTGVEIPTDQLISIANSWSPSIWESYLSWYETSRREALVSPGTYAEICEEQTDSLYELFSHDASPESRAACEQLLSGCTSHQAKVLRLFFLEGQTEIQIAEALGRSQTAVSRVKIRALFRLKRGNPGKTVLPRRFMKGDNFSDPAKKSNIWDRALEYRLKEPRIYDPKNHAAEFNSLFVPEVRNALLSLSDEAQRILYLRQWCGFSISQTARALGLAVNTTQDLETVSIFKLKQKIANAASEAGANQEVSNGTC